MSQKTMKKYNSYNREILEEVLPESILLMMDKLYTKGKFVRILKKYEAAMSKPKLTKRK